MECCCPKGPVPSTESASNTADRGESLEPGWGIESESSTCCPDPGLSFGLALKEWRLVREERARAETWAKAGKLSWKR